MNSSDQRKPHLELTSKVVASIVFLNGLFLITSTLVSQFVTRVPIRRGEFSIDLMLLFGLTFIYMASLLIRRKQTAWMTTIIIYSFYLGINLDGLARVHVRHSLLGFTLARNVLLPALVIAGLIVSRHVYSVKSDIRGFGLSLRIILIVYLVAFLYGVIGFQLMDKSDFHQEISFVTSIQRTIDQFGLTTSKQLVPYTRRARVFLDSLNVISLGATVYALISLFQPIRSRFGEQSQNRELMLRLLKQYPASSEDFFKLWPRDKVYLFDESREAGLAFISYSGVALVVGDLVGNPKKFKSLLRQFVEVCRVNDWQPSFIHTEAKFSELYDGFDLKPQKIGEEAIVDVEHFLKDVIKNKYFRNIISRFEAQNYTHEWLSPPYDKVLTNRLHQVSNEWLSLPGRVERGFMMGYFSEAYLQQCNVLVLRDSAGTIQAFLNRIYSFNETEANFDMLRQTKASLNNSNDYLLCKFIEGLGVEKIKTLNLGLCPLVGLDKKDQDRSFIDNALQFVYSNGDRFYSFSGLHRFKSKYEPRWSDRFIVYRGGLRTFSRTLNALNKAMRRHKSRQWLSEPISGSKTKIS